MKRGKELNSIEVYVSKIQVLVYLFGGWISPEQWLWNSDSFRHLWLCYLWHVAYELPLFLRQENQSGKILENPVGDAFLTGERQEMGHKSFACMPLTKIQSLTIPNSTSLRSGEFW